MNPAQMRSLMKQKSPGRHLFWSGLLFLVFGLLFLAKMMNYEVSVMQYIPEQLLPWIAAVGSTVGGAFMIIKAVTRRKLYV